MDPLTQCLLGAAAAQAGTGHRLGRWSGLVGLVGGGLADLDVVLRPLSDPALPWQYHRHFTHALAFIPVGALLAILPFLAVQRLREKWRWLYAASFLAYATHGLLNSCTTFGTYLWWPFSSAPVAWDCVGIVDPVFTGVLILAVGIAAWRRSRVAAGVGLCLAVLYLGLGLFQHERAWNIQQQVAQSRGHERERGRVMATPLNLVIWRSIYEVDGQLHADLVRVPFLDAPGLQAGAALPAWQLAELPEGLREPERALAVMQHFHRFADGYVARTPGRPTLLADMRYSMVAGFAPLWGIDVRPGADPEVRWSMNDSDRGAALSTLWGAVTRGEGFGPLPD